MPGKSVDTGRNAVWGSTSSIYTRIDQNEIYHRLHMQENERPSGLGTLH